MNSNELKEFLEAISEQFPHNEYADVKVLADSRTVAIEDLEYWPGSKTIVLKTRND